MYMVLAVCNKHQTPLAHYTALLSIRLCPRSFHTGQGVASAEVHNRREKVHSIGVCLCIVPKQYNEVLLEDYQLISHDTKF